MRERAKQRADELRHRAYRQRKMLDPNMTNTNSACSNTNVGILLRDSAKTLGKIQYDVSIFEASLAKDWINDVEQMKGMSIERLSHYMPYGLAHEIHKTLSSQNSTADELR